MSDLTPMFMTPMLNPSKRQLIRKRGAQRAGKVEPASFQARHRVGVRWLEAFIFAQQIGQRQPQQALGSHAAYASRSVRGAV
jgi:hypothetical protein